MNQPTPAIVAQSAVRRLPRMALLLLCAAYVLPGFVGREPWKSQDITAFGYMLALAGGETSWLHPSVLGQPPEFDALLPYWLGAWAMQLSPSWLPPDFAARLPFIALLALTFLATWYGVYYLSRSPQAQPVAFAFGGEASPVDYARAIADGGLLALIACLGLAQLSHETTPALAQLGFTALSFYALAALPYRRVSSLVVLAAGLTGVALSGAAAMSVLFALGGALIAWHDARKPERPDSVAQPVTWAWLLALAVGIALLATALDLWRWRVGLRGSYDWPSIGRLLLWFTWPAWPLVLWTLWRWRRQLASRHVALPIWFSAVALGATIATPTSDRSLLLALPALAALAAFALPTLQRSVSALIDWFTLLFFSGCALVIWVIWLSMQTGVPAKPAANVVKLAPGFEPSFSALALVIALAATLSWGWLVRWRVGRNQAALWKSLVLPGGGAALCWVLVMTLWLPVLDYALSYAPVVRTLRQHMNVAGCVEVFGLNRGQVAALRYHGALELRTASVGGECPWLVVADDVQAAATVALDMRAREWVATVRRPANARDNLLLYRARR